MSGEPGRRLSQDEKASERRPSFTESVASASSAGSPRSGDDQASTTRRLDSVGDSAFERMRGVIIGKFLSCSEVVALQAGPDRPAQLHSLGAEIVGQQIAANRCTWVTSLWLEDNDIGVTGAQHLAHGLSENKYLTELSLASNPIRTDGFKAILAGLSSGSCPLSSMNVRACQIMRVPIEFQGVPSLKEVLLEDNPILFPPREVLSRGTARIITFLKELHETEARAEPKRPAEPAIQRGNSVKIPDHFGQPKPAERGHFKRNEIHGAEHKHRSRKDRSSSPERKHHSPSAGNRSGSRSRSPHALLGAGRLPKPMASPYLGAAGTWSPGGGTSAMQATKTQRLAEKAALQKTVVGGWWHSVLPSMDPVALTWQKPSAAEEEQDEEDTGKLLTYTDFVCEMTRSEEAAGLSVDGSVLASAIQSSRGPRSATTSPFLTPMDHSSKVDLSAKVDQLSLGMGRSPIKPMAPEI